MRLAGTQVLSTTCLGEWLAHPQVIALLWVILAGSTTTLSSSGLVADEPVHYTVVDFAIPESLTGRPGNPVRGQRIVRDADNATCLICHAIPIPDEPDPGDIGPPLHGVGSRYSAGELRLRLVDPKLLNPDSVMPSYYRPQELHQVAPEYMGKTIYSAEEIEDVIAYLLTLTEE